MLRSIAALLLAGAFSFIGLCAAALAQAPSSTVVSGRVLETSAGIPLAGAKVSLQLGTTVVTSTTTASDGSFTFENVAPGDYTVIVSDAHYLTSIVPLHVAPGQVEASLQTALTPALTGLNVIANVSGANSLATTATLNENLNPSILQAQDYVRAGDALGTLPWVTSQTSSSVGDDETIQLRGFDPSESVSLIDGHPFGPLGACPSMANPLVGGACPYNNQGSVLDYQLGEFWGLSNIAVTYGSGAMGLYGVPTLGGSVDFETINPTPTDHLTVMQGLGDLSHEMTGLSFTGTDGRLGFAVSYGVEGTNGLLNGPIEQSAMLSGADIIKPLGGKDQEYCPGDPAYALYGSKVPPTLLAADVTACTTMEGSEYDNRNNVIKFTYQLGSKTSILVSEWNATNWANGVGNGENYWVPYDQVLAQAESVLSSGKNNFKLEPSGTKTTCSTTTLAVLYDNTAGYECLTAPQFASAFYGPFNKGPGVWHTGLNQDYHARVTQQIGAGQLILDGYVDNYDYLNQKSVIIGYDEQDTWLTHGGVLEYNYATPSNDVNAGTSFQHQMHETNQWTSPPCAGDCYMGFPFGDTNYFINDTYTPSDHFSIFSNFTLDNSKVSHTNSFDPRLSFVYRPDPDDVFRITGGHASISPDPVLYNGGTYPPSTYETLYNQLSTGTLNGFEPSGAACTPLIPIIQGFNADVKPEEADDGEVALAHRFLDEATVEIDGYDTTETNPLITDVAALSVMSASQLAAFEAKNPTYFANALAELNGPGGCESVTGITYTQSDLGVSTPLNGGSAEYRGAQLRTRVPLTRELEIDGNYTVQTAYYEGLSTAVLVTNGGYVNGQQFYGIPTQTAAVGVGYNNPYGEVTARIDSYHLGNNNSFYRPAFWYANANISKTVQWLTFNLGISNLFNSDALDYGLMNVGTPYPQNQYVTSAPQLSEEFFLPGRQVWLTTTVHF